MLGLKGRSTPLAPQKECRQRPGSFPSPRSMSLQTLLLCPCGPWSASVPVRAGASKAPSASALCPVVTLVALLSALPLRDSSRSTPTAVRASRPAEFQWKRAVSIKSHHFEDLVRKTFLIRYDVFR